MLHFLVVSVTAVCGTHGLSRVQARALRARPHASPWKCCRLLAKPTRQVFFFFVTFPSQAWFDPLLMLFSRKISIFYHLFIPIHPPFFLLFPVG